VELGPELRRTLEAVSFDNWCFTLEIVARVNDRFVKATAINNRLRALEVATLVVSERRGKRLFWKRAK
jgi:hypothetical protein